jgi:hypothetical protein
MIGLTALDDVAKLVFKSAPVLASVLGGPLAGVGVSLLSGLFGGSSFDPATLLEKIQNDPTSAEKLKELEYQHSEMLAQIQQFSNEVADRKDARQREIELVRLGKRDLVPSFIAVSFLLCYFCVQIFVIYSPSPMNDIISARVQDIFVMIISYYFGSSFGSHTGTPPRT